MLSELLRRLPKFPFLYEHWCLGVEQVCSMASLSRITTGIHFAGVQHGITTVAPHQVGAWMDREGLRQGSSDCSAFHCSRLVFLCPFPVHAHPSSDPTVIPEEPWWLRKFGGQLRGKGWGRAHD